MDFEDNVYDTPVDPPIEEQAEEISLESDESSDFKERENWTGRLDFLLSCIGFAVGLGNIWRFPYLCYKSGGGAFLIPYTFFLITCGLPLFFMEISYGQFASLSPITVWRISPLFKGLGYGMVIVSGLVCIYYNIIITWNFYFLFNSMTSVLPWSQCGQSWNTPYCALPGQRYSMNNTVSTVISNVTLPIKINSPSEEFWEHNVLGITDGIEHFGQIRWPLFGLLFMSWLLVFLCLFKGVKSSGKVVYVTATFPYLVLVILLGRGLTLPGAKDGIKFYAIPDFNKLKDFRVWGDAAVQIFYSVGMAWGSLITMASYNKFNNNVFRDAIIVPLINCSTSVFAGFVIFSVLGFMAHTAGQPINSVVKQGPGLTFIAYPAAVAMMPASQLWAILFFLMIFTIGIDSQFGMFETMTSAFIDEYPQLLRRKKLVFTGVMCFVEFLLGIPFVYDGGIYLLTVMDWYSATFSLMLLSFTECMVISWIYGINRFARDIEMMTGKMPSLYWRVMWKYVTPSIVLFTWCFSVGHLEPVKYGSYVYPYWAIAIGWAIGCVSLIPIPVIAIKLIREEESGTVWQRIKKLVQPAISWGPSLTEDRERYLASFTIYEKERFQAVYYGLDIDRYLQLPKVDDQNQSPCPETTLNVSENPMEAQNILPVGASNYIPFNAPA